MMAVPSELAPEVGPRSDCSEEAKRLIGNDGGDSG